MSEREKRIHALTDQRDKRNKPNKREGRDMIGVERYTKAKYEALDIDARQKCGKKDFLL